MKTKVLIIECKEHGLTEYSLRNDGRYRCKKCAVESVQRRRDLIKVKAVEYKGGECCLCGYDKYIGALEFHHLDPNEKDFGVSAKGYTRGWDVIKNEIDKCVLLCANCHREVHQFIRDDNVTPEVKKMLNNNLGCITPELEIIGVVNLCGGCGKTLSDKKSRFCQKCCGMNKRKIERPSQQQLLNEIEETSYSAVGRKYGVSDNSIRKWVKAYEKND